MPIVPPSTGVVAGGKTDRLVLSTAEVLLEILPSVGGRIVRLFDRLAGRDWLWANPHLPLREPVYGRSYVQELDGGGWDEILPSVAPCSLTTPAGRVEVPDHGDLVQLPWRVLSAGAARVEMEATGRSLPFLFRRRVELRGRRVLLEYRLENRGAFAFPWLWCAHPLLPFDSSLQVETDALFRVHAGSGAAAFLQDKTIGWDELPSRGERWAVKLFSAKGSVDRVVVRRPVGGALEFSWNVEELPYLGLWVNNGGWSGCGSEPYENLGIEPSTLAFDDLSAAGEPPFLPPGEIRRWHLQLDLYR